MTASFRIALSGLGTVGSGLLRLIHQNADELTHRTSRQWQVVATNARDNKKRRPALSLFPDAVWEDKPENLLRHKPDAIVELIGGSENPALGLARSALEQGIPVVTANKALIAEHGFELAQLAETNNTALRFEAAVAGALPVIKILRESLAANHIVSLAGILNSTCNAILTTMSEGIVSFDEALEMAQDAGFAEADPRFDIEGLDSAHKLAILASIAFGLRCPLTSIDHRGITGIQREDIQAARDLGYAIRLMGVARRKDTAIWAMVSPMLVPLGGSMNAVRGVNNGLEVHGNFCGRIFLQGEGAGAEATASAVAADLSGIARGRLGPPFGIPINQLPLASHGGSPQPEEWYLRLRVRNQTGVIATVSKILGDHRISIHTARQDSPGDRSTPVDLVLKLHRAEKSTIDRTIANLADLPLMTAPISCYPIFNSENSP